MANGRLSALNTVPLIDGHGNFGSVDANPAASMRHNECRLSKISSETLLDDINLSKIASVEFLPNFDGSKYEPSMLPAKVPPAEVPVLLRNGGGGHRRGNGDEYPPHNPGELMGACVAPTEGRNYGGKEVDDAVLMRIVPAPDFSTEACVIGRSGARRPYTAARTGSTRSRCWSASRRRSTRRSSTVSRSLGPAPRRAEARRCRGRGAEQPPEEDARLDDVVLGELPRALQGRDGAPALHAARISMLLAGDPPRPRSVLGGTLQHDLRLGIERKVAW